MKSGFTLLEILVVVLIITILATIVGVQVANKPGEARTAAATAQILNIKTALRLYKMEQGHIPTQRQGLQALCVKPTIPPIPERYPEGGYIDSHNIPKDPWGNVYIYLVPGSDGSEYEVTSYGSDGEPGGENENADISSSAM